MNDAFEMMTGFKKDDMLGNSLLQLMGPTTDRKVIVDGIQSLDRGESCELELAYSDRDGAEKWAQISFAPVRDTDGEFSHWICIGRDVTERRENERELRESLQEKETLLMEIHHRVKNNLAVVSSMMQLQAMEEVDESLQKKLYDSVARIRTMVTIHELLYESRSFAKIDFSENLKKLTSMIIESIQVQDNIQIEINCDPVILNVNQAIPLSLIVNEVITNACKHAFTNRETGKITIDLKESGDLIDLTIPDNGRGLPNGFVEMNLKSLGLKLIDVLSQQMNTTFDFMQPDEGGTSFHIKISRSWVKGIGNAYLK